MVRSYIRTVPAVGQQECRLYRFWVTDPRGSGETVLGYIGETARAPWRRLTEHIDEQPWAADVVAWEVDPRVFPDKAAVLEAERIAIETEQPLYNVEHNTRNPYRVDVYRQRGPARRAVFVRPASRSRARRRWPRWRVRATAYASVWLGVSVPLGVWSVVAHGLALADGAWLGAAAGGLVVSGLLRTRPRRRRRW